MKLSNTLFAAINEKVAAETKSKTNHDKQVDTVKSKVTPYLNGVPATADYGNLTKNDVHSLLKSAEEKDEEVETVTFGLETEEGDVVKVYVNVEDADKFEEALSKLLGTEDDLEKVLDELSNEYDIVDVKWPNVDDEDANKDEHNEDDEETAAEKLLLKKPEESDETEESDGSDTETDELNFDEVDKKPAKKQKTTEEKNNMAGFGDNFLQRVLGESSKPRKKDKEEEKADAEIEKNIKDDDGKNSDPVNIVMAGAALDFQRELSNRYQRLAFQTAHLLGIPLSVLVLRRTAYKHNLRKVSEQIIDNSQLRIWLKRLANALADEEISVLSDAGIKEDVADQGVKLRNSLQTKVQREIYDLLLALGVPEDSMLQRRSIMRNIIVNLGFTLQKEQRLRVIFRMVLSAFGIGGQPDSKDVKESLELVFEDDDQNELLKFFNNQTTYGAWLFLKIATTLGIPASVLRTKLSTFKTPLVTSLRGKTNAVKRLIQFAELLNIDVKMNPVVAQESLTERKMADFDIPDADSDSEVEIKSTPKKATKAEDLGDWNIGKSSDFVMLSIADKKIELDDEQYEKIIDAMADAKAVSTLVNNVRVSFKPEHHGKIYVVKWNEPHQTYPDGVLMSETSIKAFLDGGSSK